MATTVIEYRPPTGIVAIGDEVWTGWGKWTVTEVLEALNGGSFMVRIEREDPEPCCECSPCC